ncbi:substrate-binding domain-containing protein [Thalassoglobus polymorphus]|uniref:D-ribose-binding periplasmic protein n=1 Tax=Thalassoglobus polymorphus TaxID=2527994 RepID=A0A517QMH7_9PLAN|nr:substrate-binding domain-containing protein [Thalassoglobus polymorphus]QDT32836.1 D-ribose-binding periplasmic protein precursor [Thalassoglobus polymorphus]
MFRRSMLVSILSLILLGGCAGNSPESESTTSTGTAEKGSRGTIGFSALDLKNPFFKIIADTLTEAAEAEGFEVIVTDAESDVNNQSKQVDNFITQEVTAIVLNPANRESIGTAIKRANEAGIPVFTCDLQCAAEGAKVTAHIGTDNYSGGRLAGKAMIEALGEAGGNVLVLHFKQANSCVERVEGFNDEINEYNANRESGKINVVSELEGGATQDVSFKATQDGIQQHPNLSGIFAINDPSALGAYTALSQAKKTDQIIIVGFDGQLEGKQAIKEGKIYADPIQFPKKMATGTVANIVKYLDGEDFNAVELIPTELYRKADAMKDPELQ